MATLFHANTRQVLFQDEQRRVEDTLKAALQSNVDLRGVHLKDMTFHGALQNVDFSDAVFERCRLYGRAQQCRFNGATFRSTDMSTFKVLQCDFKDTTWLHSKWRLGHLDARSSLAGSRAQKSDFSGNDIQSEQLALAQWDEATRSTLKSKIVILKPLTVSDNLNAQLSQLTGDNWTTQHFKTEPDHQHLRPQGVLRHLHTDALVYIPACGMGSDLAPYAELQILLYAAQNAIKSPDVLDRPVHFLTQTGLLKDGKPTSLGMAVLDSALKQINLSPMPPVNEQRVQQHHAEPSTPSRRR